MKQCINTQHHLPGAYDEMSQAVQEEWDNLKQSDWNPLLDSMFKRLKECRKRQGMQTRW
ncbi:hypothetical protein L873DRAFT_1818711 [Choiromyces venosus 120613-1]|uniref:Uncharacterized protein n=1 Tax=Choiromyces venosus 120613-1 TaxID=1336337 RepID=A0A3N4J3L7_9PEZI|nr:hypothetical protein L873DRAFT_1818711 [Choiromyces venosus 120613-1]